MQTSSHTDYRMSRNNVAYAIERVVNGYRVRELGPYGRVMTVVATMAEVEALFA